MTLFCSSVGGVSPLKVELFHQIPTCKYPSFKVIIKGEEGIDQGQAEAVENIDLGRAARPGASKDVGPGAIGSGTGPYFHASDDIAKCAGIEKDPRQAVAKGVFAVGTQANISVVNDVGMGRAGKTNPSAQIARESVARNNRLQLAADDIPMGIAINEYAVGPIGQRGETGSVHSRNVGINSNPGGIAANVNAIACVARADIGSEQVVTTCRSDENTVQPIGCGGAKGKQPVESVEGNKAVGEVLNFDAVQFVSRRHISQWNNSADFRKTRGSLDKDAIEIIGD